jgi:hypothetical protein
MFYAFDLTQRQANRVLTQAQRSGARIEIEPRNWAEDEPISGGLKSVEPNVLAIDLDEDGRDLPLAALVGAFCDVSMVLSGQLFYFASCVLQVHCATPPYRVVLAAPTTIQVGNRRQFVRRALNQPSVVRLRPPGEPGEQTAELCNASGSGLACRVGRELDDELFIGDPIRVRFQLPGLPELFDLDAIICNKTPTADRNGLIVGVKFDLESPDENQRRLMDRLRAFICNAPTLAEPEGRS